MIDERNTFMLKKFLAGLAVLSVMALGVVIGGYFFACPCETVPGGSLRGQAVENRVQDWSFVNDRGAVPLCQIEVDFPVARSMNVNCMALEGSLYVSCSRCADKKWAARALTHPDGRVQVAGKVYPISYRRILPESDLDRVWRARAGKLGRAPSPRPEHWWSFHLAPR